MSDDPIQSGREGCVAVKPQRDALSRQRAMANLWKRCLVVEGGSLEPAPSAIACPRESYNPLAHAQQGLITSFGKVKRLGKVT